MDDLSKEARTELVGRISDQSVLAAFKILVYGMAGFGKFQLTPDILGQKMSLNFKTGRVSYFAFIANRS